MKSFITPAQVKRARELSAFFVKRDGEEARARHLQEECAELIEALYMFRLLPDREIHRKGEAALNAIYEETADVLIMAHSIFDLDEPEYDPLFVDDHFEVIMLSRLIQRVNSFYRGRIQKEALLFAANELNTVLHNYHACHVSRGVPEDFLSRAIDKKLDRTEVYVKTEIFTQATHSAPAASAAQAPTLEQEMKYVALIA